MDSSFTVLEQLTDLDPARVANLPQSTPITIRSVAIFSRSESETLIYVGTGGGKLILLSVNPSLPDSVQFVQLISISSRLIEAILVLPEIERVLVLSDGFLYLIDWQLSLPVKKLGFLKEVTAIARRFRSESTSISSEIRENGNSSSEITEDSAEPSMSDTHCISSSFAIAVVGKKLVVIEMILSDNNVNVHLKEMPAFDGIKAVGWVNESIFIGNSNGYFLVYSETGKSNDIFTLPESSRNPKLMPLSKGEEVLLLVDNLGVVIDPQGQPKGGSLVFKCMPDGVCQLGSYLVVSGDRKLEIYRRNGECVQSIDVGKFGSSGLILGGDETGKGEMVAVATTSKVICYRKASVDEQIKALLKKSRYREAISLSVSLELDGEITKRTLSFVHAQVGFLLFFDLRFEEAVDHFLLSEEMDPSEVFPFIMQENRWSRLVSPNRYWALHPPPAPLEEVIDAALARIQNMVFLKRAGLDANLDEGFLLNLPSRADLLELAIRNIIRYLVDSRNKELSPEVKEGVDTLLMYLYRALDLVPEMENLASSDNNCVVEELELLLNNSGHLRTLAFLYGSKGMDSKSVSIWRHLARNYAATLWRETADHGTSNERKAAEEASKILQFSSDEDLVLEHLTWISDIDEDLAVTILISEKRTKQLSPENVLEAIDSRKVAIRQSYLQWLIEDQECDDPRYHTLYALSLARSALEEVAMGSDGTERAERSNGSLSEDCIDEVANDRYSVRERLQLFLQASDLYNPEELLEVVNDSELWLEKAILYRKMGQENIVLQILALKLEDSEAAEQYCAEIGRDDAYIQLLDLYLDPQNGREPMFTAAVRLLHNHGESLDPLQVLEKLSPEMPLQLAADTILRMLRARVHHHRQGQIVHSMSRAINLDAKLTRMEERSRHVQLNDESMCDSCHARLGTKLFVMYPDNSVVCYRCYRNQGESPSTNGQFFKKNVSFRPGWLVTR
ncbi:hypothetical protein LUZ63_004007 [Rhynchospora breviuscula]|uniref:CNH domain-containing protein n=1 Tax=Rhynchospora breviuscula TaxID=2022672 RepID=A0A9Q0D1S4_9POAL|nr:hypothetical protein LUZ63_004007 [Rhynchospora breviuscula]